ncbi:hypothetical protein [Acinetobacter tianfuensis]|uniref:Lipoprotein n=1 Tax=Acinetobacter tianfuensis TaxID=2419603 RepID=A0A3A8E8D9_9GAMM|nr:hypothetical protein [Acinetobacter tianfuensis]RKG31077.1 hypothetical protein D7V32_09335 [Acinetobacter tianfuensis]
MKKLIALLAPLSLALTACVSTGTATGTGAAANAPTANSLAVAAIKIGVQAKCVTELQDNKYWTTASRVLTETQKQSYQTEVCGCVGDKVTTSVTAAELVVAAMDKASQANLISKVVTNSLNACVVEKFKS